MKYQVTFRERNNVNGEPSENPPDFLEPELTDGIVRNAVFAQSIEPDNLHGEETMDEDDDFLSLGSATWEYDIAEGREKEFEDALKNSQMVMEYQVLDDDGQLANLAE